MRCVSLYMHAVELHHGRRKYATFIINANVTSYTNRIELPRRRGVAEVIVEVVIVILVGIKDWSYVEVLFAC